MFVFLALVFAVGFVIFGVGSDVPGGVADILGGGGGGTDQPSVGEAQEKLDENPNDAQALRELATALQTEQRADEAIDPLTAYTALRPKDEDALRELAGLYLSRASRLQNEVQLAQLELQQLDPGSQFRPASSSPLGQALGTSPILQAVSTEANARLTSAFSQLTAAYGSAQDAYEKVAKLAPDDASVQIQLAEAALRANDAEAALKGYRAFLRLAPDDPSAPAVRDQIKAIEAASAAGAGSSGG
jgi:tetratricopeptide (TPR) repeat protein